MSEMITSDGVFSREEAKLLSRLAELMIPAQNDMPSGADDLVFGPALEALETQAELVKKGLRALNQSSDTSVGESFLELSLADQLQQCETVLDPSFKAVFQTQVASSYYQDERVMAAIGIPPRAPFPEGYQIDETDWSVVEPVRARGAIFRNAPE